MGKAAARIAASVFALFLFLTAGILSLVETTPAEELPEDIQAMVGAFQPLPGVNVVDGIGRMTPVHTTGITSPFGWRIHPIYHTRKLHKGVDLGAAMGTPIYATRDGVVTVATYDSSAGNYVVIDHGDSYRSIYMHMIYYIVGVGDSIAQGQVIGYVGDTGDATGPHLHFGVTYNGAYVDPMDYIDLSKTPEDSGGGQTGEDGN